MRRDLLPANSIKVKGVAQAVTNKFERQKALFCYLPYGESYYVYNGERLTEKQMDERFPTTMQRLEPKGKNSDTTKEWMH